MKKKIGITTTNISRDMSVESFTQVLKHHAHISATFRVTRDYLLGVTDVMDPVAKNEEAVKDFDDR